MHKQTGILLLVGLFFLLAFTGCKNPDMDINNQTGGIEIFTYSPEELEILEEDGLSASEIEELNKLNQDIELEDIEIIPRLDNEALINELLDIAIVTDIEGFCYETDSILEGFNVELASEIAEYMEVDFHLILENSIENCFSNENIDCVILNSQDDSAEGYQYSEEFILQGGTCVRIAVRDNEELLKELNQALSVMETNGILDELERSYID